ncbi:MAG: hypothetical protein N4A53_03805 [Pelagimonas sp.]|jgi:hypothetical protein|nr:hypothetical protein [Pelagimonas sp.]
MILGACGPDMDFLIDFLPPGVQPIETLSKRARLFDCQQATFRIQPPDPQITSDWERLATPYSSSFLRCLTKEELASWADGIRAQQVRRRVINERGYDVHYWHDSGRDMLLIMLLET